MQQQIRSETATLIAQIEKEKAKLAILLVSYKAWAKKQQLRQENASDGYREGQM